MTGLYGKNHGVYDLKTPLPPAHTTLAEVLAEAGYDTLAVVSARHLGDHNSGLGQGFAETVLAEEHLSAEMAVERAIDWIERRRERPFFLWLHLFDPHTPHTPPAPYALGLRPTAAGGLAPPRAWLAFRSPGAEVYDQPVLAANRHLYAGEVAYLDRQVDRLLGFLQSRDLLGVTVVALVADHGENLGEHGIDYRHIGLWETTTRVPMMVRRPGEGRRGRRLGGLVETIDLFPTLLRAAGLPVPAQDGRDLDELTGDGRPGRPAVFAEHASRMGVTARTREHRYVRSTGNPHLADGAYLYDRAADPGEERSLAGTGLAAEARLSELLARWLGDRRPSPEAAPRELSPADLERLRALGYL
jgi:arylsulfatase A-like enzyme